MEQHEMPRRTFRYELGRILPWLVLLLTVTVLPSLAYKTLIEMDFFKLFVQGTERKFVFCVFEFILIVAYWYCVYLISKKYRHRCSSLKVFYIRIGIVFASFAFLYWMSYIVFGREDFMWVFRLTINLICFRFETLAPENLIPYMIAFLIITLAVMMFEPRITQAAHKAQKNKKKRKLAI